MRHANGYTGIGYFGLSRLCGILAPVEFYLGETAYGQLDVVNGYAVNAVFKFKPVEIRTDNGDTGINGGKETGGNKDG